MRTPIFQGTHCVGFVDVEDEVMYLVEVHTERIPTNPVPGSSSPVRLYLRRGHGFFALLPGYAAPIDGGSQTHQGSAWSGIHAVAVRGE